MATHTCHVTDCDTQIRDEFLMCHAHWKQVPFDLQDEVNRQYGLWKTGGSKMPSKAYASAAQDALTSVVHSSDGA